MALLSTPPANAGARLLPSLVDEIAQSDPTRICYSIAKTSDPADGFFDISAAAFAKAVDRCAWFIHNTLGPGERFPTIAYMGPQDIVYLIFVIACGVYKVITVWISKPILLEVSVMLNENLRSS